MNDKLTYIVQPGENLISIARKLGLNSIDQLISLNNLPANGQIIAGQELILPEEYTSNASWQLRPSHITAEAPDYSGRDFNTLPKSVQDKSLAYAQAVSDGAMTYDQVPELYKEQVFNTMMRDKRDGTAPVIARTLALPATIWDYAVRAPINEAYNAYLKYVKGDDLSNRYQSSPIHGFSIMNRSFAEEHPIADMAINTGLSYGLINGGLKLATTTPQQWQAYFQSVRQSVPQSIRSSTGLQRVDGPPPATKEPPIGARTGGNYKGIGKGKSTTKGRVNNWQGWPSETTVNTSVKGTPAPFVEPAIQPLAAPPASPTIFSPYLYPMPHPEGTKYTIQPTETQHIQETYPMNPWIYGTTNDVVAPYVFGSEVPRVLKMEAPVGSSVQEQPFQGYTETITPGYGVRSAGYVPGVMQNTDPNGQYSGFGFTYGTTPGSSKTNDSKSKSKK